jgi:HK97 family phage prohead protease
VTRLAGYALLWGDEAAVDGEVETFRAYSFTEPLIAYLTAAHLPGHRYASTSSGQLRLAQDDVGLRLEVDVGEDREWDRLVRTIAGGMRGASFTFKALAEERDGDRVTITRARLSEVCITGSPAYSRAGVWFQGEDGLPPRLATLQRQWQAHATVNRPARIDRELAAFAASQRWSTGLVEPAPQACAVGRDPVRRLAGRYVGRYVGGR